jgi:hypothetical protein
MFAFFKGIQRVSVGNHNREGDALVEFYLSVEKAYSLGFGKAEALDNFDGLPFEASVDTSVDAIGHGHMFGLSHDQIVRHLSCEGKMFVYVRVREHDHPVITRACHRKLMRRDLYVVVVSRLSSLSTSRNGQ